MYTTTNKIWYAFQRDEDDVDWGSGTYDADEAREWLEENPHGRIAVIDEGPDPIAIDEWYGEEYEGYRRA